MEINQYLKFAESISNKTSKELLKHFGKTDTSLRGGSLKTTYDFIADKIIKKGIEKNFPTHSYITEETGFVKKDNDYLWVIDPLDGTGNFVNNNPLFAVSIALWIKGQPVLGIMDAPYLKERYIAIKDKGAWMINLKTKKKIKVRVSQTKDLSKSYIITCEGGEKNKKRIANIFHQIYLKVRELRKLGSAAIECAWVGLGRADAYYTTNTYFWDIGAGVLFVKEAGGKILHFNDQPYKWDEFKPNKNYNLVVSNGKIKMPKI